MGKVSAYPFRREECCNISAIKLFFLKKKVYSIILSIVCAMKFAFMICNRGKAKLMLLFQSETCCGCGVPGRCCAVSRGCGVPGRRCAV